MNKYRLHAEYSPCSCKESPQHLVEIIPLDTPDKTTTCWNLGNIISPAVQAMQALRRRELVGWVDGGCSLDQHPVVLLETTNFTEVEAYMLSNLKEEEYDG